jgi:hypothetical protein
VRAVQGLQVRSDAEIEASLTETLDARPTPDSIWVFGYGSLMWNPAFAFRDLVEIADARRSVRDLGDRAKLFGRRRSEAKELEICGDLLE